MATRKQKFQVFLFLFICLLIVLVIVYFVSGMYSNYGVRYRIEFDESILGVYEGGVVEYLGVPVGKVEEIKVSSDGKPYVTVNIDSKKVTLHEGVEASIVIYSLAAGTMAISLHGGDPNAPILPPGSKIPARRSTISAVSSRAEELIEDLKNILDSIKTGLEGIGSGDLTEIVKKVDKTLEKGETLIDDIQKIVKNVNTAIEEIKPKFSKTMDTGEQTINEIKELSKKTDKLVSVITEKVQQIDIQKIQENVNSTSEEINKLATELKDVISNTSYKADNVEFTLQQTLQEVNQTLESLRNLLESIQKNPSSIIRGKNYNNNRR